MTADSLSTEPRHRTRLLPRYPRSRARLADLCAAEWIKLWSLRSTPIGLGLVVALALYLAGNNSMRGTLLPSGATGPIDPIRAAFDGPSWVLPMIGAGMIGAQSMVGEHASGLIRTTLIAVPGRLSVVAAKVAVMTAVMALAALVAAVGGLALALATATTGGSRGRSLTDSAALHAIAASVLLLPVCALVGMAVGTLLRHAAATGFTVCSILGFGPLLLQPDGNRWATDVANVMPYYAWGRLTSAGPGAAGTVTAGVAWCTLAAWAALSIVITAAALNRRDV